MAERVTIIGSGPAGFTAAIYAARANLEPLVFEGFQAGGIPGGQLMTTTEVENYPGFPDGGISGPDLMDRFRRQALDFGTRAIQEDVVEVDLAKRPFVVKSTEQTVESHALIIATGATARRLRVPSEEKLWSRGMSACAVCDGALPMFRNKELLVIGGGDSAMEEASFLTKFAARVVIAHRRDSFRASKIMQERVLSNQKIEVLWNTVLVDAEGSDIVTGARLRNVETGEEHSRPFAGIFYAIGHDPNTRFLRGQVETDSDGYIVVRPGRTHTSVDGVFACGDVVDKIYRQAITAAGTGCAAALDAEHWLSAQGIE
ncbi:MAG TPA: thioredoxin-disulfide reductase [Planctomycetota bacterium]|nr:thioredoxin-disulfide reductase [Planctomycetota bacterium]